MMENLYKETVKTGLVLSGVALLTFHADIFLGFLSGFLVSLLIMRLDEFCYTALLAGRHAGYWGGLLSVFKIGLYALGFLLAVRLKFNLFGVAVGYLCFKLTLFRMALLRR